MSWQEELRKLDEELASGRLSADDYRVRRDQVLSSAVASGDSAGQPQGDQSSAPQSGPQQSSSQQSSPSQSRPQQPNPQQSSPQPSQPQQSQPAQGRPPAADSTQIIAPISPAQGFQAPKNPASPAQGFPAQNNPAGPGQGFNAQNKPSPAQGFQAQGKPSSPPQGFPAQGNPEATQVVPRVTGAPPPEWRSQRPQDPESTQFVTQQPQRGQVGQPQGFQPPPQGYSQLPVNPWNAPDADVSPPWGGSDLPPISQSGNSDWISQGPEVFENKPSGSGKNRIIAVVVAVLLLGGIAFGAYWIWGRGTSETADPGPQPNPPGETSNAPAPDPLPVAVLTGTAEPHHEVKTFEDVPALNYLNSKEIESYQAINPGETKAAVQILASQGRATLLLTIAGAPTAAATEVKTLGEIQVGNGAKPLTDSPAGVTATEIDAKDGNLAQIRGHYMSGDVLVRVDVMNATLAAAKADFQYVVNAQMEVLPPTG